MIGSTIYKIARALEEPGDLAIQMKLDHPDITREEEYWCSNFQKSNSDCPKRVGNWLKNHFL